MIRRNGNSWEVRVYVGIDPVTGKERIVSRSFRMKPGETKPPRSVRNAEARIRTEARDGKLSGSNYTVAQVLDLWLAQTAKGLSPWTLNGYRGVIERYIKPHIGTVKAAKLTPARVDALYHELSQSGGRDGRPLAPRTVHTVHVVLRRAMNRAERHGQIFRNPVALAQVPKATPTNVRATTPDEVQRLLAACEDEPTMNLAIRLAAATGARRGELCGLRWSDVDLDRQTVTIARSIADPTDTPTVKMPKTGKARSFTIGPMTVDALREHRKAAEETAAFFGATLGPDAYVLSDAVDSSTPVRPGWMSGRFRKIARKAGVACRLHDLRHGHVTLLLSEGVSIADVAARVGHASATMTLNVYAHAIPAMDRRAAEIADL